MRKSSVERRFSTRWLWVWGLLAGALLACGVPVNELNELLTTPTAVSAPPPITPTTLPHSQPTPPPTAVVPQPPLSLGLEPTIPILGPGASYTQNWSANPEVIQLRLPAERPLLLLVTPTAGWDVRFTLSAEMGEAVMELDERGAGEPELLFLTPERAQLYEMALTAVGRTPPMEAAYTVVVLDLEAGGDAVRLDTTAVLEPTDIGRHSFAATAGETFFFLLEPDSTLDPLLELYTPNGFLFSEDSGGPGAPESRLFTANRTANHQLVIFPFGGSAGSYRLRAISLGGER